jgi:hypothetical protein
MSAITTDNLRLVNCNNFIKDIDESNYYIFIGLPNYTEYFSDWNTNVPDPIDSFQYYDSYKNTILGVKKITSSDVIRVIPKITWKTGIKYDMYRHDYSRYNLTNITNSTRLYDSRYYVMNSDYRVYICLYNGSSPDNANGVVSVNEPTHTSESPQIENDGYIWKYLYTITPAEALKFDSTNYISVPNNWTTSTNAEISRIRDSASEGRIEVILIETATTYAISQSIYNDVEIVGDGVGGRATVEFDEEAKPTRVTVTEGGSGYTFATLNLDALVSPIAQKSIFNVIIPPPGGHGKDVYKELGAFRSLVYSRIENSITNPDFIEGNQFARIGIVRNITQYGAGTSFTSDSGSGVLAIKLTGDASNEPEDSLIVQNGTGAKGVLVSTVSLGSSSIIKYIQPRENYLDTYASGNVQKTFDPYITDFVGLTTSSTYLNTAFNANVITINGNNYTVDNTFSGSQIGDTFLGQVFSNGFANPDINTKSGEIVYIDNRVSVTRQSQQREDIKIIIEF